MRSLLSSILQSLAAARDAEPLGIEPAELWRRLWRRLVVRRFLLLGVAAILLVLGGANGIDVWQLVVAFALFTALCAFSVRRGAAAPAFALTAGAPAAVRHFGPTPAQWQALVDANADASVLITASGRVAYSNAGARAIFPRIREAVELTTVIRHPEFVELIANAQELGTPVQAEFAERVPIQRQILARAVSIASAATAAGEPTLLVILKDLTERGQLAQMRTDFVSYASHELRTPLASVLGFIETLQGPARHDEAMRDRFLDIMAAEAERMTRLIDDLLSLSRVEMKTHLLPDDPVELVGLAEQVVDTLDPQARDRAITLEVAPYANEATLRGDRDDLVQLLMNLVNNAIRYGREGGHVVISIESTVLNALADDPGAGEGADCIALAVTDDGPGIAQHHIPRLTERFYRIDAASSRSRGGTGLGLAIVKHIVTRHRGRLSITSTLGEGSRFCVLLPVHDADRRPLTGTDVSVADVPRSVA